MATFEVTRDLRSDSQDPKRAKDRSAKWLRGARPTPGYWANGMSDEVFGASESVRANLKIRPARQYDNHRLPTQNIVKAKMAWDVPPSHARAKVHAMEELSDPSLSRSLIEMLPNGAGNRQSQSASDGITYTFDKAEGPGKPVSLDVFVKANPRETEKFVEKEYEILDLNGDALKGRKARKNLRLPHQEAMPEPETVEDDGFELV